MQQLHLQDLQAVSNVLQSQGVFQLLFSILLKVRAQDMTARIGLQTVLMEIEFQA